MAALTAKQQRFVAEYLIDLNATQAAIRAGYSSKTAEQQGHQLLKKTSVAAAIANAQSDRAERTQITQDMVLRELAKIGFSDLRKTLTPSGHLIDPHEWDDDTAAAISSLEVVKTHRADKDEPDRPIEYTHKIKTWDKVSALEKIGRHLGMFTDKIEHSGAIANKVTISFN